MTSILPAIFDLVEETWAAVSPPDRKEIRYRAIESQGVDPGSSSDRVFWFDPPSGCEVVQFDGVDMTVFEWTYSMRLRLILDGYSKRDRAKRTANEIVLLLRAVNTIPESSFPSGARGLLADSVTMETRGEELIATFLMKAQTEEID